MLVMEFAISKDAPFQPKTLPKVNSSSCVLEGFPKFSVRTLLRTSLNVLNNMIPGNQVSVKEEVPP